MAIRNFIGHHGLEFDENFKGFPDHLSILFDFMTLILEKRQALEKGSRREDLAHCLKIEQAFFGQYIASWVPAYAEKVIKEARLDFYRDLARLTRDFVEFEMAASGVSSPT